MPKQPTDTEPSIPDFAEFLKNSSNPDATLHSDETIAPDKVEVSAQATKLPFKKAAKQSSNQLSSSPQPNTITKKAKTVLFTEREVVALLQKSQQARNEIPKLARPDNLETALVSLLSSADPATQTFSDPIKITELISIVSEIDEFNKDYRQLLSGGITLPQLAQLLSIKPNLLAEITVEQFLRTVLNDQAIEATAQNDRNLHTLLQQPVTSAMIQAFSNIAKNVPELNHLCQPAAIKIGLDPALLPYVNDITDKLSIAEILKFNQAFAELVNSKHSFTQQSNPFKKGITYLSRQHKKDNFIKDFNLSAKTNLSAEELKAAVATGVKAVAQQASKATMSSQSSNITARTSSALFLNLYTKQLAFEDTWRAVKTQIDAMLNNKIIQPQLYDIVPRIKELLIFSHSIPRAGYREGPINALLKRFADDCKGMALVELTKLGKLLIQADALEADLAGIPLHAITEKQDLGIVAGLSDNRTFLQLKDKIPLLATNTPLPDKLDVITQLNALLNVNAAKSDSLDKFAVVEKLTELNRAFSQPFDLDELEQVRERQRLIAKIDDRYLDGAIKAILSANPRISIILGNLPALQQYLKENPDTLFNTRKFFLFLQKKLGYTLTALEITRLKTGFRTAATATLQNTPYKQANVEILDDDELSANIQTQQTSLNELNKQFRNSILKEPGAEFSQRLSTEFSAIMQIHANLSATDATVSLLKAVIKDDEQHNEFMGISETRADELSRGVKAAKNSQAKLETNCLALLTQRADSLQKMITALNKKIDTVLFKNKRFDLETAKELMSRFKSIKAEIVLLNETLNPAALPEIPFLQKAVAVLRTVETKAGINVAAGTADGRLKQNIDILQGRIIQAENSNKPLEEIVEYLLTQAKSQSSQQHMPTTSQIKEMIAAYYPNLPEEKRSSLETLLKQKLEESAKISSAVAQTEKISKESGEAPHIGSRIG